MKRLFLYLFILLVLAACSKDATPKSNDYFTIYGLGLGASVDEITSELGIPDEKQVYHLTEDEQYIIYSYPRLFLGFKEDVLVFISSIDPEFSTSKGIRINDDKRKVLIKYKKEDIFCLRCNLKEFNFAEMPTAFYIEDGDIRMVFGGKGTKIEFIQIGRELPKDMIFAHSLNPMKQSETSYKKMGTENL